jgi:hypothetical protein
MERVPYSVKEMTKAPGESNVSEKQDDMKKLIEKMRTNTDKLNRKTEALPRRRSRRKMEKGRPTDGPEKQK